MHGVRRLANGKWSNSRQKDRALWEMEVDILISSAFEAIVSPCNIARAIGIPDGSELRFRRDGEGLASSGTIMVVRCDKPTASRLRHRFSAPRLYTHDGLLTSLKFVAMRPVSNSHAPPWRSLPRDPNIAANTAGLLECSGFGVSTKAPPPSTSPGVETALDAVESDRDASLHVPGIAELYDEFLRSTNDTTTRRPSKYCTEEDESSGKARSEAKSKLMAEVSGEEKYSSSEEKNRALSSDSFQRGVECCRMRRKQKRRHHRRQSPGLANDGDRQAKELVARRIAAHRRRWQRGHAYSCVAGVASALDRISRVYSDAPQSVSRSEVVLLVAKLYSDGTAFAGNRQRDMETLDRLGVVNWHAETHPRTLSQAVGMSALAPVSRKALGNWVRLVGRVVGLVRNIVDFGMFVQLYVVAVERHRLTSATGECKSTPKEVCWTRTRLPQRAWEIDGNSRPIFPFRRGQAFADNLSLLQIDGGVVEGQRGTMYEDFRLTEGRGNKEIAPEATNANTPLKAHEQLPPPRKLQWLFPRNSEEDGKRAFDRHVVCGGAMHGLITTESAACIIRDAGKDIPVDRVWRWCCQRPAKEKSKKCGQRATVGALRRRFLLDFQEFVEMCQALKKHMKDAAFMSPDETPEHAINSTDETTSDEEKGKRCP